MIKKVVFLFCCFSLLTAFQCEDEPLEGDFVTDNEANCIQAVNDVILALDAFIDANDDNYTELCNAYKSSLEAQISACGDENGALQASIDALGDCINDNEPDTTCEDAEADTQTASEALDNASTDEEYAAACEAYKEALQSQIDICGDEDGSLQDILDELGEDCISDDNSDDIEISVVAGTLLIEFDDVVVVQNGTTLEVTGEDTSTGYTVYFEVEQNATGTDIINSTFVLTLTSEFFPSTQGFDDFTSEIVENTPGTLFGTFFGLVTNADGGDLSLTQGQILISY